MELVNSVSLYQIKSITSAAMHADIELEPKNRNTIAFGGGAIFWSRIFVFEEWLYPVSGIVLTTKELWALERRCNWYKISFLETFYY